MEEDSVSDGGGEHAQEEHPAEVGEPEGAEISIEVVVVLQSLVSGLSLRALKGLQELASLLSCAVETSADAIGEVNVEPFVEEP